MNPQTPDTSHSQSTTYVGRVVKLDRGFPLVELQNGECIRCKHATSLVKTVSQRAVIGDAVDVAHESDSDIGRIEAIHPRTRVFVRKDPTERVQSQTLAANFDLVIIAQPLIDVNTARLKRELVLAYETGAHVIVVLTKADLSESDTQVDQVTQSVMSLVGDVQVLVVSQDDMQSVQALRSKIPPHIMAILIGRSGVGKSSLVNLLVGSHVQETTPVREGDGKGRHTTVSREMIRVPGGGYIVDMPGIRGLGLWNATDGIRKAFSDIVELSTSCRFRDCRHVDEPGCAVRNAVDQGKLSAERVRAYRELVDENNALKIKREEARRIREHRGHPRRRGGNR